MSIGVMPYDGEPKLINGMAIASVGGKECMIPTFFVDGVDLEAKRKNAHRHIDECIDVFKKEAGP